MKPSGLGVKIPGIFGVFYYRSANPKTFADAFQVPSRSR